MIKLKRAAAALLAAVITASAAGCSNGDKSWAAKYGNSSVPIGSYITYLYTAYSEAESKVTDSSKKVLDQKIDNKDAAAWIREKALSDAKVQLLTDKKLKDLNITLTDAELKTEKSNIQTAWNTYSTTFEKYGIAQSSFEAVELTNYKMQKIFEKIYGKGGTKAVSDDELKSYYVNNFTNFSFMGSLLYTTDDSGNFKANFSDADKKKTIKQFDDYAEQIRSGKATLQQVADAYKKASNSTSDVLTTKTINPKTDTTYPDSLKKAIAAMKTGEVKTMEITESAIYVLIVKNDINKTVDDEMKTDAGHLAILQDYKWQEFQTAMQKEADSLSGVSVNDSAINSYDPKMFES